MSVVALSRNETAALVVKVTTPEELIDVWPFVRSGLVKIKKRQHVESSGWVPENIRQSIVLGQSELWLVKKDECVVGFVVTQIMNDPFLNIPYTLFIWMAYSVDGGVMETERLLAEYGRSKGCRRMEALTQRRGLERRLHRYGWKESNIIIYKDLYPEE